MYKRILIFCFLLSNTFVTLLAQNSNDVVNLIAEKFTGLSSEKYIYSFNYVKNKETLIFKKTESKKSTEYKILIKVIHPEGIFFEREENFLRLKILSIDNGNRFIESKYRDKIRLSNTTNIILFDNIDLKKDKNLLGFVKCFRSYMKVKNNIDNDYAEPKVIVPKTKN